MRLFCLAVGGVHPARDQLPPPAPAMTSPSRALTWISLKPRSAAKQALKALAGQQPASPPVGASDSDVGTSQASS